MNAEAANGLQVPRKCGPCKDLSWLGKAVIRRMVWEAVLPLPASYDGYLNRGRHFLLGAMHAQYLSPPRLLREAGDGAEIGDRGCIETAAALLPAF